MKAIKLCIVTSITLWSTLPYAREVINDYYSKKITFNENIISLSETKDRSILIQNKNSGEINQCTLNDLSEKENKDDAELINITSDKKAIIFYSSGRYIKTESLINCTVHGIDLHESPDPLGIMVQDINFSKKIYLSYRSEDINNWTALVAKFGSEKNLIKAKFFFDPKSHNIDEGFKLYALGMGRISPDGKYVAPTGPDCEDGESMTDFPGVWDIEKKKRIVFKEMIDHNGNTINSNEVLKKCCLIINSGKK